jgi:hypothetical protein
VQLLNKFAGYEFNCVHELNADAKLVALIQLSNNPVGIVVIAVNENISENVVAVLHESNKSSGIEVIPVPLIKPAN